MNTEKITKKRSKFSIFSVIIRYFTEPYKKYDGEWKGLCYYERMADRRFYFTCIGMSLSIVIIILVVLLNAS